MSRSLAPNSSSLKLAPARSGMISQETFTKLFIHE